MGKSQRTKGAAGERELAQILSDELGIVVKRKLSQARDGGDDIQIGQFRVECKRQERIQIEAWFDQARASSAPGDIPVVAFRRNGKGWKVCLELGDFIRMMREFI